jgi:hypothetical protein
MKVRRILFIIFQLISYTISRIIEGVDFVNPERFLVEGVESQSKADEKTEKKDEDLFSFEHLRLGCLIQREYQSLFHLGIWGPRGRDR